MRRAALIAGAALALVGAALARPLVSSAQAPKAASGAAYQALVTVTLPIGVSPVSVKIPVPAGKRLDIERVALVGAVSPAEPVDAEVFTPLLATSVGGKVGNFPLPAPTAVPFPNGIRTLHLFGNTPMFGAFADGGNNSPVITIDRTDLGAIGTIAVTLSGRLE
jgi:hypothetical protein